MKKIPCMYKGCSDRRAHYERPDEKRERVLVEIPDDLPKESKVYCSIECAAYDGALDKPEDGSDPHSSSSEEPTG